MVIKFTFINLNITKRYNFFTHLFIHDKEKLYFIISHFCHSNQYFLSNLRLHFLKLQWQIWDILQGVSSLVVQLQENV